MARDRQQGEFSGLALITGGFVLVAMSIGGYAIGALIDRRLGTAPNGAIIGLLIGTVFGFWDLYRIASRVMNRQPVPTHEQQKAAEAQWEKIEKTEEPEGDRDENHE